MNFLSVWVEMPNPKGQKSYEAAFVRENSDFLAIWLWVKCQSAVALAGLCQKDSPFGNNFSMPNSHLYLHHCTFGRQQWSLWGLGVLLAMIWCTFGYALWYFGVLLENLVYFWGFWCTFGRILVYFWVCFWLCQSDTNAKKTMSNRH